MVTLYEPQALTEHAPQAVRPPVRAAQLPARFGGRLLAAGAMLAGMALVVSQRARQAERDYPPEGRFVEVDGVRLHYAERGRGQPVVLLHGNGSMIQDFAVSGLLDRVAERYRVIAFDRPGCGYSDRPRTTIWTPEAQAALLSRAFRQLGIERPIVVGHSWGSLVAVALALEHPAEIRSLVLLSGYYFPTARLDVALFAPPAIPVLGDVLRYTIAPLLGALALPRLLRRIFAPSPVSAPLASWVDALGLRPSQIRASAAEAALMIPAARAFRHRYRELTLPVSIVAGTDDRITTTGRQSARLSRALLQSHLHLVPGAGHMVHHDAPQRVMAAIDEVARAA